MAATVTVAENGGYCQAVRSNSPKRTLRGWVIGKGFMENFLQGKQMNWDEHEGEGRKPERYQPPWQIHGIHESRHHGSSAVKTTPRVLSWFECEMFPKGSYFGTLGPQLVALFGEGTEPLKRWSLDAGSTSRYGGGFSPFPGVMDFLCLSGNVIQNKSSFKTKSLAESCSGVGHNPLAHMVPAFPVSNNYRPSTHPLNPVVGA